MQTQKIQITLTPEEVVALSLKSKTLGYNVTKYVKFIVMKEAFEVVESIPTYKMSQSLERKTLQALKEHKRGMTKKLADLDHLDDI